MEHQTNTEKIATEGMIPANLNSAQIDALVDAEKKLNNNNNGREIYLLAVTRK